MTINAELAEPAETRGVRLSGPRDAIATHRIRNSLNSSGGAVRRNLPGVSALAVAGPVRECPRTAPSEPPHRAKSARGPREPPHRAKSARRGTPGVLGEQRLSRRTPARP